MTHEEMIASGQHECAPDCPPMTNPPERSEPKTDPRTARWYGMTPGEAIGAIERGEYVLVRAAEQSVPLGGAQAPTVKSVPLSDEGQANRNARLATMHPTFLEDGAQATPQPAQSTGTDDGWHYPDDWQPAAQPAGSADTALPLGSTSNGALDNAQGPNQLQGNVATPAGSADTALREALERLLGHGYQPMYNGRPSCPFCSNFVDDEEGHTSGCILVAALAAQPTSAEEDE